MTREEQIIEASQLYAKHQQKPFMDGALWADRHPKDDPLEGILIHGNNDAYRLGYKDAIDKFCEFMESCVGYVVNGEKCNYENFIKYMNNLEE
jgi:hypothetical protein